MPRCLCAPSNSQMKGTSSLGLTLISSHTASMIPKNTINKIWECPTHRDAATTEEMECECTCNVCSGKQCIGFIMYSAPQCNKAFHLKTACSNVKRRTKDPICYVQTMQPQTELINWQRQSKSNQNDKYENPEDGTIATRISTPQPLLNAVQTAANMLHTINQPAAT